MDVQEGMNNNVSDDEEDIPFKEFNQDTEDEAPNDFNDRDLINYFQDIPKENCNTFSLQTNAGLVY